MSKVKLDRSCLRHTLIVQRRVNDGPLDERGQQPVKWVNIRMVKAQIETLGGREIEFARRLAGTCTHRVTIRHHSGLSIADRFIFPKQGLVFHIEHIANIEFANVKLEILVHEEAR